jgi:hypothetical protein
VCLPLAGICLLPVPFVLGSFRTFRESTTDIMLLNMKSVAHLLSWIDQ